MMHFTISAPWIQMYIQIHGGQQPVSFGRGFRCTSKSTLLFTCPLSLCILLLLTSRLFWWWCTLPFQHRGFRCTSKFKEVNDPSAWVGFMGNSNQAKIYFILFQDSQFISYSIFYYQEAIYFCTSKTISFCHIKSIPVYYQASISPLWIQMYKQIPRVEQTIIIKMTYAIASLDDITLKMV